MTQTTIQVRRRTRLLLTIQLLLLLPAAVQGANTGLSPGRIWQEFRNTHLLDLIMISLGWIVVLGIAGVVVFAASLFSTLKLGLWRSGWKHARWIRWPLWLAMFAVFAFCAGSVGFWHGLTRGGEVVLRQSQLATEAFPPIGNAMADALKAIELHDSFTNRSDTAEVQISRILEPFRSGAEELDVVKFHTQLGLLHTLTVSNVVASIESEAIQAAPTLASGFRYEILHGTLTFLGTTIVDYAIRGKLKNYGLEHLNKVLDQELPGEAAKTGDHDTISRNDASALLVQEVVVPLAMRPVKSLAKANEIASVVVAVVTFALLTSLFRFTCGRVKLPTASTPP